MRVIALSFLICFYARADTHADIVDVFASMAAALSDDGDEARRDVDLDWYLELRSRTPGGPSTQRRSIVHCRVEKEGKHWRVVSLKPASLFDAPKY